MKVNRYFLILLASLVSVISFPVYYSEGIRHFLVQMSSPLWHQLEFFKSSDVKEVEIEKLLLEKQLLLNEIDHLKKILEQEIYVFNQSVVSNESAQRHQKHILDLFQLEFCYLPAKVVYRPVNLWNSSLWVNRGEVDNELLKCKIISKNSPVVKGKAIIGVVDYVGKHHSRIRLISDPGLNPSVRVKRGDWLLAKGELVGQIETQFRSPKMLLSGEGFNYDFSDEEGPARDLRSGAPFEKNSKYPTLPLVHPQDLLITTGMDGVFPPGLEAAIVKKVFPLKEGDYTYHLEAEPVVGNLSTISTVFILPPIRQEELEE